MYKKLERWLVYSKYSVNASAFIVVNCHSFESYEVGMGS